MSQITLISDWFVRPKSEVQESKKYFYLSPICQSTLSFGHSQYGLLFTTTNSSTSNIFDNLKRSLSETLVYFYPLAGRLVTQKYPDEHKSTVLVDCTKGPGARLIHASALDLTVDDIACTGQDIPVIVQSLFDLGERQVNHDGHTRALLSLQLTQLQDGVFIGCCMNHCVADAFVLSRFLNVLSQTFCNSSISHLPVIEVPSSISDVYSTTTIPYLEPGEYITRYNEGYLRDRIFHFSNESIKHLKVKANEEAEMSESQVTISSFKAMCGLVWMSITRARKAPLSEETILIMSINLRPRLNPPLSPHTFGSYAAGAMVKVKVGELLANGLGWIATLIHQKVEEVDGQVARDKLLSGSGPIRMFPPSYASIGSNPVLTGGSPWLDIYGAQFGLGEPLAVLTGYNRDDGKLAFFPGRPGSGSVDLQVSLRPETMSALLLDEEFMHYVSS